MAQDITSSINQALTPEECGRMLFKALEAGDIDTSVALYEPVAVLFQKSGQTVTGHQAIRASNEKLITLKPTFTLESVHVTLSGDGTIATTSFKATLDATRTDGKVIHDNIHTLEVMRKQPDGSWRYLIDDPYGSMRASMTER
jgi:ketosteroid isomerase-like protein